MPADPEDGQVGIAIARLDRGPELLGEAGDRSAPLEAVVIAEELDMQRTRVVDDVRRGQD